MNVWPKIKNLESDFHTRGSGKHEKNIFIQKKEDTYANQAWMKVFGKFTLRVIDRVFNWKFYGLGENY